MLDVRSTSFVISPKSAKPFAILVVKRAWPVKSGDISTTDLNTDNLFMIPLVVTVGNHGLYNEEDYVFEVIKTFGDDDALLPARYLEKHKARGMTTSHLHCPHCQ
jgi:hypothetical protein